MTLASGDTLPPSGLLPQVAAEKTPLSLLGRASQGMEPNRKM